jgi:SHS2 domain-containing protein
MSTGFEELDHTADIALRVRGSDLKELFVNAALGMAHQLADPTSVVCTAEHEVSLRAGDVETLLVSWLSELLYLGEREGAAEIVFTTFDVRDIGPNHINATVRGGPATDLRRYIKAVTFSDLSVRRTADGYQTVIVFDV